MNLSNFRIGTKLAGVFSVLLLLTAAVGTLALFKMGVINANMREVTTNSLPSVLALNELQSAASFHRRRELQHVLSVTPEEMAALDKDLADAKSRLSKLISDYAPMVADAQEQALFDELRKAYAEYVAVSAKLVALSSKGSQAIDEAKTFLRGPSIAAYRAIEAALDKLAEKNRKAAERSAAAAESTYSAARMVVMALMAAAIVLATALAFWITRLITRPLAQAVKAAERIADGDLTVELAASGRDETAQLLQAMAAMAANLRSVVADVRTNSDGVSTAAQQIASGNLDLSARTEQQASSLQETASSMEQITGAVKQNADSAQQGNQLAQAASRVAARGGQVVEQVVGTMREINDSSKRIADIIGVIDGIAFQTNILALNAAVEAARAGEAGRGFAVVAGEVRTLAQRSADAAREIKTLIGASVERVQAGSALVDEAGSTMREVVVSIRRVEDLMGEITAASTEQSSGIGQVNEAVSQMDQVTQQNAALVEEASAAAASLREQAAQLVEAVSVFRVASEQAAPRAVPAHRAPARGASDPGHRAAERAPSAVRTEPKPAKAAARPAKCNALAPASADTKANWQTF